MALFMAYTIAISALLVVAAHLVERLCVAFGRPSRSVWMAAIPMALLWPVFSAAVERIRPDSNEGPAVMSSILQTSFALPVAIPKEIEQSPRSSLVDILKPLDLPLALLWAAASLALVVGLLRMGTRARELKRGARPEIVSDEPVLFTHDVGPAVLGLVRYQILLPQWVTTLPASQKQLIVIHEREHVKAFDPLVIWSSAFAVALFPWNVALWYMMRRLRNSIELDCDLRVLELAPDVDAYTSLLVDVGERVSSSPGFAAALTEGPSQLRRRIIAMTKSQATIGRFRAALFVSGAVLLLAAAVSVPQPKLSLHGVIGTGFEPVGSVVPVSQTRSVATVNVTTLNGRAARFHAYTTDSAELGIEGRQRQPVTVPVALVTPIILTADLTGGEVHFISDSGAVLHVTAAFTGSPAKNASMDYKYIVLDQGGVGVRGGTRQQVKTRRSSGIEWVGPAPMSHSISDSVNSAARRLEPSAFDKALTPGSSVIGLLFGQEGKVIHHASIPVADSVESLLPFLPRLFPDTLQYTSAPLRMMILVDGAFSGRNVQVVASFLKDPRK